VVLSFERTVNSGTGISTVYVEEKPRDRVEQWWANYGPLRGSIRPAADFKI